MMLHQEKELPNDSWRSLKFNNFTDKKTKWLLLRSNAFLRFLYGTESSPTVIHSPGFANDYKFKMNISSGHSNLNFAHHFVIHWLLQNGSNKNQHQGSHQRETIHDKFAFFSKLGRRKRSIGWAKYVYVCMLDMCWWNVCVFFLVTKKCEKYVTYIFSKTRGNKNKRWTHLGALNCLLRIWKVVFQAAEVFILYVFIESYLHVWIYIYLKTAYQLMPYANHKYRHVLIQLPDLLKLFGKNKCKFGYHVLFVVVVVAAAVVVVVFCCCFFFLI